MEKKKKNQQFSIEKSIFSGGMIWYWKDSLLNYANSELLTHTRESAGMSLSQTELHTHRYGGTYRYM